MLTTEFGTHEANKFALITFCEHLLEKRVWHRQINIEFLSIFLVRPQATVISNITTVKIARPVTLTCKVYGFPKPEVSWMKHGQKIENDTHYNISFYGNQSSLEWYSDLEIENVRRNDTANYKCFLRNRAGTDDATVSLVVLGMITLNVIHIKFMNFPRIPHFSSAPNVIWSVSFCSLFVFFLNLLNCSNQHSFKSSRK